VGDKAYPLALSDSNGNILHLSDIQQGWYLVLVFYRGYWCGSCVSQLLDLKNDYPKFTQARAAVAAISVDPVRDSARFAGEWRFPFPLLSDTRMEVIDAYGLRHPKGHDNKDISHVAVVILDPQKTIRYKYVGKNPQDRPSNNEILFEIQKIQGSSKNKN
jgi:peroxiredoxin